MELTINAQTKISQLLEVDRDLVINTLVGLNKNFSKLRNPVLRNLLVKRVSIADVCKISKTDIADFMLSMKQIGFQIAEETPVENTPLVLIKTFQEPLNYFELDVRSILAQDKDPLKEILASVKKLNDGQGLKLINTFEPLPLIHLLEGKGFSYRVEHTHPNMVVTYFSRSGNVPEETVTDSLTEPTIDDEQFNQKLESFDDDSVKYIDVRNLEMPKPMLAILEQTPNLNSRSALFVYHKKIPVYLLPELEKQGLGYAFKTIGPGDVNMLIYKK
ncbi:MAG: DUF2249 domain-containing protein [Sphingobacteriaceae bacterium]|nr:MAG: DUF2249 domain-containing protein [Sphingobacteriaceae bacterium]